MLTPPVHWHPRYQPNQLRAVLASGGIAAAVLTSNILVAADWMNARFASEWEQQAEMSAGAIFWTATMLASAVATTVAWLFATVAYLVWLHRAVQNARNLSSVEPWATPQMAMLCWFIPILNLFRPYQVVRSVCQASRSRAAPRDWVTRAPWIFPLWWGAWLLLGGLSQSSMRYSLLDDAEAKRTAFWIDLFSLPVGVVAAVCALGIIWSIESRQRALAAELGEAVSPQ